MACFFYLSYCSNEDNRCVQIHMKVSPFTFFQFKTKLMVRQTQKSFSQSPRHAFFRRPAATNTRLRRDCSEFKWSEALRSHLTCREDDWYILSYFKVLWWTEWQSKRKWIAAAIRKIISRPPSNVLRAASEDSTKSLADRLVGRFQT